MLRSEDTNGNGREGGSRARGRLTSGRRAEEGREAGAVSGMVTGGPGQPGLEVSSGDLGLGNGK